MSKSDASKHRSQRKRDGTFWDFYGTFKLKPPKRRKKAKGKDHTHADSSSIYSSSCPTSVTKSCDANTATSSLSAKSWKWTNFFGETSGSLITNTTKASNGLISKINGALVPEKMFDRNDDGTRPQNRFQKYKSRNALSSAKLNGIVTELDSDRIISAASFSANSFPVSTKSFTQEEDELAPVTNQAEAIAQSVYSIASPNVKIPFIVPNAKSSGQTTRERTLHADSTLVARCTMTSVPYSTRLASVMTSAIDGQTATLSGVCSPASLPFEMDHTFSQPFNTPVAHCTMTSVPCGTRLASVMTNAIDGQTATLSSVCSPAPLPFEMDHTFSQPFKISARSVQRPTFHNNGLNTKKLKITLKKPLLNPKIMAADIEKLKNIVSQQKCTERVGESSKLKVNSPDMGNCTPARRPITIDTGTLYRLNRKVLPCATESQHSAPVVRVTDLLESQSKVHNPIQPANCVKKEVLGRMASVDRDCFSKNDCVQASPGHHSPAHNSLAIIEGLYSMQKRGRLCDLKIKIPLFSSRKYGCNNKKFRVIRMHKNIFTLHSVKYFAKIVDLTTTKTSMKSVQRVIEFMYTGAIKNVGLLGYNAVMLTYGAALAMGVSGCVKYLELERPEIKTFTFLRNLDEGENSYKCKMVNGGFIPFDTKCKEEAPVEDAGFGMLDKLVS